MHRAIDVRSLRNRLLPLLLGMPTAMVLVPAAAHGEDAIAEDEARAWVHLDGSSHAVLQREQRDGSWTSVCSAPCDRLLHLEGRYRIDGHDVRTSAPFRLDGAPGDHVVLKVDAGDSGVFGVSIAGIVVGVVTGLAGVADIGIGDLMSKGGSDPGEPTPNPKLTEGTAITLVGVGLVALGIVGVVLNATTTVSQKPDPTGPDRAVASDAFRPAPTWHAPSTMERALPPAVAAPLWTFRF